jgi:hypothetical protein
VKSISIQQIRGAIAKYFLPVFDSNTAIGAVTVSSGKAEEVIKGFETLGFDVERRELPSFGNDSGSDVEMGSDCGSSEHSRESE